MSILRPSVMTLAFLSMPTPSALAQDKPAPTNAPARVETVESLKKEFQKARSAHVTELCAAIQEFRKKGTEKNFKFNKEPPRWHFSRRFLAIAENNPQGPEAVEALKMALQTAPAPSLERRSKHEPKPSRFYTTIMPPSR